MADLFRRKSTSFVLWLPGHTTPPPQVFLGAVGTDLANFKEFELTQDDQHPELWSASAKDCGLVNGKVYYYWFRVVNTDPYDPASRTQIMYCTDPFAWNIDRRVSAPIPNQIPAGFVAVTQSDPAGVVKFEQGKLVAADPNGATLKWNETSSAALPSNNHLVIYELPTRWTRINSRNGVETGNGTFRDVLALLEPSEGSPTFPTIPHLQNRAHLKELGVNAIELLPPADSDQKQTWGYGTNNFFAPDFELGFPISAGEPTALADLSKLIETCHLNGLRVVKDVVMAFCTNQPWHNINFRDFLVQWGVGDPEQGGRDGFGGDLFRYRRQLDGYRPIEGDRGPYFPARQFLQLYLRHWIQQLHFDGLRLDSVNNIDNYDFLESARDDAMAAWERRGGSRANFMAVGESLPMQMEILHQNRLDGLWNETFKSYVRRAIVGRPADGEDFEWTVRKLVDCRYLGFGDGSQATNYLTSHDVGGESNERLYNYLRFQGLSDVDIERRVKLGFVCLLTAVGIPMILAGEEFADEHDLNIFQGADQEELDRRKQIDPVNFSRLSDAFRRRIFDYVARLVKLRTTSDALAINETAFLHSDFTPGRRILVWQRGRLPDLVVVVANFSDWGSSEPEYRVPNWPLLPEGWGWSEITQARTQTS